MEMVAQLSAGLKRQSKVVKVGIEVASLQSDSELVAPPEQNELIQSRMKTVDRSINFAEETINFSIVTGHLKQ